MTQYFLKLINLNKCYSTVVSNLTSLHGDENLSLDYRIQFLENIMDIVSSVLSVQLPWLEITSSSLRYSTSSNLGRV